MTFPLNPADVRLIEQVQQATRGARVLLCTLARRGKALDRDQPERATFLLTALRPHPLYKGARLAFDMLEIEDLMLDAAPVEPLHDLQLTRVLGAVARRGYDLADIFLRLGSGGRDGEPRPAAADGESARPALIGAGAELPPATALLPRLRFEPDTRGAAGGSPARDGDGQAADAGPELVSSDYLYDYVVLGFVELLARGIGL